MRSLLVSLEWRWSDFPRNRLEFFDGGLEGFLDVVQLLLDLRIVISGY